MKIESRDRAAIWLEEQHVRGDAMVPLDHAVDEHPELKGGAIYVYDLLAEYEQRIREDERSKWQCEIEGRVNAQKELAAAQAELKEVLMAYQDLERFADERFKERNQAQARIDFLEAQNKSLMEAVDVAQAELADLKRNVAEALMSGNETYYWMEIDDAVKLGLVPKPDLIRDSGTEDE